jgi:hypothetical protein
MIKISSRGFQYRFEVFHHTPGLHLNIAFNELARCRVYSSLPCTEYEIPCHDPLGVGANSGGGLISCDSRLFHLVAPYHERSTPSVRKSQRSVNISRHFALFLQVHNSNTIVACDTVRMMSNPYWRPAMIGQALAKFQKAGARIAMSALIGFGILAMPSASVLAAAPAVPPVQQGDGARLELLLKRLNLALDGQSQRLRLAGESADLVQEWIDLLNSDGKDTAPLQTALDQFNADLVEAQASHDEAARILGAHAGFDDDGKLTDRPQAIGTLRSAGRALRECHRSLVDATIHLRSAIVDWRQSQGNS